MTSLCDIDLVDFAIIWGIASLIMMIIMYFNMRKPIDLIGWTVKRGEN